MIEVEHVSRLFDTFRAVDDISFSIQTGEIVGLLGPNGAGKTTTMRMICGFLEPSAGCIRVDGMDVTAFPVETKRKIGYMPESAPLYGDMIVADYLEYVARMQNVDPKERVPHLASVCGLGEVMHKNIADLSRGNRQRVGLAHALMGNPEILILDEPTSGLDPNQVTEVRSLIKEIGKTRTVIVSTHILSEVESLCNRVIIISAGKKLADSSTEELQEHYGHSNVVRLTVGNAEESSVRSALESVDGVESCSVEKDDSSLLHVTTGCGSSKDVRPAIAKKIVESGWSLYEIEMQKNSLEDVFRTITMGGDEK
ncbi:MAG: ATP-binding cassette domain-containing protein [Treponema sp.]|jgi:ABC-2 type transport system ATP-binding protein|nr:ATP-binding cassette domain-containing protein [Treponema sp.]HAK69143.1 multidrug ABC transporter ATP-binding protein [Treponema sp.]HBB42669.1 multidrug ABC transporter ATP-binding protein [Treponema sp.]